MDTRWGNKMSRIINQWWNNKSLIQWFNIYYVWTFSSLIIFFPYGIRKTHETYKISAGITSIIYVKALNKMYL